MEEVTKEVIVFILIVVFVIAFILQLESWSSQSQEKANLKKQDETKECLDKINDRDWCFDKFYR